MSKYQPLLQFLSSMSASPLRLSFRDVEAILGFSLPPSAFKHDAWWSNDEEGHSQARGWLKAGWRTSTVDLATRKVTFERQPGAAVIPRPDPFGCMAGTITLVPGVDLTAPSDEKWNAENGRHLNE